MSNKQATSLARAAALAVVALAAACTDAGESMRIVQNQVPQAGCVIPTSATAAARARGRIETRAGSGYLFTPVIQSLLVEDEGRGVERVVSMRGADIDVTFPDGFFSASEEEELRDDVLTRFSSSFSGTLPAGGTLSVDFIIIPTGLLERVDAKLDADTSAVEASVKVVAFGDTDGGEVESIPFYYPVTICTDCVSNSVGECSLLEPGDMLRAGGACNQFQDDVIDCCTSGGMLQCPAEVPGA